MSESALTLTSGAIRAASLRAAFLSVASAAIMVASLGYAVIELRSDENTIAALQTQLDAASRRRLGAESIAEKTIQALQANLTASQTQLTDVQKRGAELQTSNLTAQDRIAQQQQAIRDLTSRNSDLAGHLNDAKYQIETLSGQVAVLRTTANAQNGITERYHELQQAYNSLRVQLGTEQSANNDLRKQVELWQARANAQNASPTAAKDVLRSLELCRHNFSGRARLHRRLNLAWRL